MFMTRSAIAVILLLLATPCVAQSGDVSGIPPGPANLYGPGSAARDPSGIGNAARAPVIPPPSTAPVPVPSAAPLNSTTPPSTRLARRPSEQWRHLSKRERRRLEKAAVKENDRLLGRGVTSICRGC